MQADRDALVREAFEPLRELCELRGVAFTEIDLRWGLTDQEAAEGQVLARCLQEIDDSRPYFIGLLGERYGWVPDQIPDDISEEHEWLRDVAGKSVTEIEIRHGVLRNPEMHSRALFYLRDPAYVSSQRYRERADDTDADADLWREPDAGRAAQLEALKAEITAHPGTRTSGYTDPQDLAKKVREALEAYIERDFPVDDVPDPVAADGRRHELFAQARTHLYVPRQDHFARLDEFASQPDGGVQAVVGFHGVGVSSLLANWALNYRARHSEELVLMHFIGSSPQSTELGAMLSRLNCELGRQAGEASLADEESAGANLDDLRRTFERHLGEAGAKGKVILVLDSLELLSGDVAQQLDWMPEELPVGVRVIVSAGISPRKEGNLVAYKAVERRGWLAGALEVGELQTDERREVLDVYLSKGLGKRLSEPQIDEIINLPTTGTPFYLRTLVDELRRLGRHDELGERLRELADLKSVSDLIDAVLERCEADQIAAFPECRRDLVAKSMGLIWASRNGLSEGELLDLLATDDERLLPAYWSPLRTNARSLLVDRDGLLGFAHPFVRPAVEARYLVPAAKRDAVRALADYFRPPPGQAPSTRSIEEFPRQLLVLGEWDELSSLLADEAWAQGIGRADPSELTRLWAGLYEASETAGERAFQTVLEKDSLAALQVLEAVARQIENPDQLQLLLGHKAWVQKQRGQFGDAMNALNEQERICQGTGDIGQVVTCRANRGLLFRAMGPEGLGKALGVQVSAADLDGAVDVCFQQAISLARDSGLAALAEQIERAMGD